MTVPTKAAIIGDKQPVTMCRQPINKTEVLIRLDKSLILTKVAWLIKGHQSANGTTVSVLPSAIYCFWNPRLYGGESP